MLRSSLATRRSMSEPKQSPEPATNAVFIPTWKPHQRPNMKLPAFSFCLIITLVLMTTHSGSAAVALIPVQSITAHHRGDNDSPGDGSLVRLVNGAGINQVNPNDISTWTHGTGWQNGWQGANGSTTVPLGTGWVVLDFGSVQTYMESLYLWNVNESTGTVDRGVQDFNIWYADSPTVAPPPATTTQTAYDFNSGGWTQLGGTNTLAQGVGNAPILPSGSFDLTGIPSAQYIGLEFLSNYGSTFRVGLAEIAVTVPEPGRAILLFLGAAGLVLRRRR